MLDRNTADLWLQTGDIDRAAEETRAVDSRDRRRLRIALALSLALNAVLAGWAWSTVIAP